MSDIDQLREQVRRLTEERAALIACLRRGVAHSRKLGHALGWMTRETSEIAGIRWDPEAKQSSGRHVARTPSTARGQGH